MLQCWMCVLRPKEQYSKVCNESSESPYILVVIHKQIYNCFLNTEEIKLNNDWAKRFDFILFHFATSLFDSFPKSYWSTLNIEHSKFIQSSDYC